MIFQAAKEAESLKHMQCSCFPLHDVPNHKLTLSINIINVHYYLLILELLIIIALPSKNINYNKLCEQSVSSHIGLNQNVFVCLAAFSLVVFCLYPWRLLFTGKPAFQLKVNIKEMEAIIPSLYIVINDSNFCLWVIVTESWNHCISSSQYLYG